MTTKTRTDDRNDFGIIVDDCSDPVQAAVDSQKSAYQRITIPLDVARTNEPLLVQGTFLSVEVIEGSLGVKLNNTYTPELPLSIYPVIKSPFNKLFITNAAQAGTRVIILVSSEGEFDIATPSKQLQIAGDYANQTLDLNTVRTDTDVSATFGIDQNNQALGFTVVSLSAGGLVTVKLNSIAKDPISIVDAMELSNFRYTKLFMTNVAQATLELELFVPKG